MKSNVYTQCVLLVEALVAVSANVVTCFKVLRRDVSLECRITVKMYIYRQLPIDIGPHKSEIWLTLPRQYQSANITFVFLFHDASMPNLHVTQQFVSCLKRGITCRTHTDIFETVLFRGFGLFRPWDGRRRLQLLLVFAATFSFQCNLRWKVKCVHMR